MEIKKILAVAKLAEMQKAASTKKAEKTDTSAKSSLRINDADADSEIIQKESVKTLTKDNSEELISNSKGTTYVVVGKNGCGRCKTFENNVLDTLASNLEGKADFVELDCEKQNSLYNQLKRESGGKSGSVGLPVIIKVVDGKAVEFMQYSDFSGIYKDADKMTDFLGDKVEASSEKTKKSAEATTTNPNAGKVTATTSKNVDENLYNQKGTTYVQLTNTGCSLCKKAEPYIKQAAKELGDDANFISVNYSEDSKLFWKLLKEAGYDEKSAPLPLIIKYVDGKPVEILKRGDINNKKEDLVTTLKNKVENAEARRPASTNADEEDCPECNVGADDEAKNEGNAKADSEQLVLKQKIDTLKESLQTMNDFVEEITTNVLEEAIENAISISDLKDAVNNCSSGLDFNTQINLSSVANSFTSDSDLDAAKEKLLKML